MLSANFFDCSTVASSKSFSAAAERARKSPFIFSSRMAKSRIAFFNASSSASISLTSRLFTIAPDFFQKFVQFFNDDNRFVHAGEKFLQKAVLKFQAFLVAPIIFRLLPFERQFFCGADQSAFASGHAHKKS